VLDPHLPALVRPIRALQVDANPFGEWRVAIRQEANEILTNAGPEKIGIVIAGQHDERISGISGQESLQRAERLPMCSMYCGQLFAGLWLGETQWDLFRRL